MLRANSFPKRLFSLTQADAIKACPKQLFINNQWVDSVSGQTFDDINPSTEKVIAKIQQANAEDVDIAVQAAKAAFTGPWSQMGPSGRRNVMLKFADLLEQNRELIAHVEASENGKPFAFLCGEVGFQADLIRYNAGATDKLRGDTIPVNGPFTAMTIKEPVGVCGQIVPWNFPTLMAIFKLGPVLATGCTTVLKPSENTPMTGLVLGNLLAEAGVPEGVVNILPGFGETGHALVAHPDVQKVALTGSVATGKKIMAEASKTLKRVSLELGGKSPNLVLSDADLDAAAANAFQGCFIHSGQYCMASTRVFVHESVHDQFVEKILQMAESRIIGNPYEEGVHTGPVVNESQMTKILGYIKAGQEEGATLAFGGNRLDRDGYFINTTVFTDVTNDMKIAQEEIFGPVMSIIKFSDLDEALTQANDTIYGLAGGVQTNSLSSALKVSKSLKAGIINVNCWSGQQASTPFGGYGQSGFGRELGWDGLEGYVETKTIVIKEE